MASLWRRDNGRWRVDVYGFGSVSLGESKGDAALIFAHIENLETARKRSARIPEETKEFLETCPRWLSNRLLELGLIDAIDNHTVEDLEFGEGPGRYAFRNLCEFFPERLISTITQNDAEAFKRWLLAKGKNGKPLAHATVSRRLKYCRSAFQRALEMGWTKNNPFKGVKPGSQTNPARNFYISKDLSEKVTEEIPGTENRLAFALMRWGGLRIGEIRGCRWSMVNWGRHTFTFPAPKTSHIPGHESRTCPIFPELAHYFDEAWEASEGDLMCPKFEKKNARQLFEKIVVAALKRLDVEPWDRLFNNLRATRATEVIQEFGIKAESIWIGHGLTTAMEHYLMVTDEVWERASGNALLSPQKRQRQS